MSPLFVSRLDISSTNSTCFSILPVLSNLIRKNKIVAFSRDPFYILHASLPRDRRKEGILVKIGGNRGGGSRYFELKGRRANQLYIFSTHRPFHLFVECFAFFFRITNKSVGGFGFFFIPFYFFPFFLFFYFYFQRSGPPKLAPQFFIRSDLIVTPSWLSLRRFDSLDGLSIHQFFFPFFFFSIQFSPRCFPYPLVRVQCIFFFLLLLFFRRSMDDKRAKFVNIR